MARGFLSGLIWGGVASIGVVGVVSLLMPLPLPPEVGDAAPGSGPTPARVGLSEVAEQDRLPETPPASSRAVPRANAPVQDDLAAVGADAQTPAAMPETGNAEGLSSPAEPTGQSPTQPGAEQPVLPNPQALAPATPQPADELSITTEPAQPPAPEVAMIEGAFDAPTGLEAPEVAEAEDITLPAQEQAAEDAADGPINADTADPAVDAAPEIPVVSQNDPVQPRLGAEQIEQDSGMGQTSRASPEEVQTAEGTLRAPEQVLIESAPTVEETPTPSSAPATTAEPSEPAIEETEAPETTRPAIGTPATTLADRDTNVVINRPDATLPKAEDEAEPVAEAAADIRPVVANSLSFDVPKGKPLMSFVLIDDGSTVITGGAGLAALRSFPYPLSFAVDTALPDAADRVATYSAAGFEVLAMIDLPKGAQPSDAETTFAATLDRIGPVVAVLEGTGSGLQDNRAVADHVTDILVQSGHGLVTQDKGLNTMPKLARKNGVPADPVFRDFDSKGQDARVIRRFLDQAAFKARQEGAVIMLGRLRPDTVSALLLWGLQDRASDVALVPISAVLLREE